MRNADLFQRQLLMSRAAKETWGGAGAQNLGGMRIKSGDHRRAVVLGGVLLGGADHFLMAKMQSIENSDRERQRTGKGGKGIDGTENLHGGGRAAFTLCVP